MISLDINRLKKKIIVAARKMTPTISSKSERMIDTVSGKVRQVWAKIITTRGSMHPQNKAI
jgi:hypothetical protein